MNIKMYIKYIIFFCLTYYIPMVNSLTPQEIENLWDKIRPAQRDYIVLNDLFKYYNPDMMDLDNVIREYGLPAENDDGDLEYRMHFEYFKEAATKGLIPKWSRRLMYAEFKHMIPNGEDRIYITLDDMINYYVPRYLRTVTQLEEVMKTYGVQADDNQYHLKFKKFRIAMCIGDLPNPSYENGYA
ncbi:uncharacterized protein LOC126834544 [Adelges cooleyi]|uniref:uncharacterized protein LOC126834544 n=1 Tax=Adelges cooleyi TaxID=133065 RepID=UPI002180394E|nr:uncharacterized protein LOC126834544 [Adelges cooleyi]